MLVLFGVLIIISAIILGFIVLIQNPKGGGLSGTFGGIGNQIMGVKQTTDVLEKGTWIFAAVIGVLCMVSPAFIPKDGSSEGKDNMLDKLSVPSQSKTAAPAKTPNNTTAMPAAKTDSSR